MRDEHHRGTELRPGSYPRVSVEDGGCRTGAATVARIFEPFFTTKEVGRETALGLPSCMQSSPTLAAPSISRSAPDEGSTFSLYPATDGRPRCSGCSLIPLRRDSVQ